MNFEEMQAHWKGQNDENLFAVNEAALGVYIQRKSSLVSSLVGIFESVMILLNLVVGIALLLGVLRENESGPRLIAPVLYLLFSIYGLIQRLRRRAGEVHFEATLLGELERAIWRIDYLIRQGRSITLYYVLPLSITVLITAGLGHNLFWAAALTLILIPLSYFGTRWEVNKWYLPKKRALESLRESLITNATQ
jgi:hypothetical protein